MIGEGVEHRSRSLIRLSTLLSFCGASHWHVSCLIDANYIRTFSSVKSRKQQPENPLRGASACLSTIFSFMMISYLIPQLLECRPLVGQMTTSYLGGPKSELRLRLRLAVERHSLCILEPRQDCPLNLLSYPCKTRVAIGRSRIHMDSDPSFFGFGQNPSTGC